jgi:hypothetical protein
MMRVCVPLFQIFSQLTYCHEIDVNVMPLDVTTISYVLGSW